MPERTSYPFFPDNVQFWYETKRAFGASSYGASEFGEVMATVNRITSGDNDSWYNEWNATAKRVFGEAEAQLAAGHRISARDSYLRATTYFRGFDGSAEELHGEGARAGVERGYNVLTFDGPGKVRSNPSRTPALPSRLGERCHSRRGLRSHSSGR